MKDSIHTVTLTETERTTIISALEYWERRQLFLANLARHQGRAKEEQARNDTAAATAKLSDRIYRIGVDPR